MTESDLRARLLAFYLPQFHPVPENDRWWGQGFTEWRNVAGAKPLFPRHDQPRVPADLGFYDLRLTETQEAQAALARTYGIEGFCVWHYWFHGKRLLERPIQQVLEDPSIDFPFCLAWANEPWSRRWLGEERDILQDQTHSEADDLAHARWLAKAFSDPRYVGVRGRPLFAIYRPAALPLVDRTVEVVKRAAVDEGLPEPYLVAIDAHAPHEDFLARGFDAVLNFEPALGWLPMGLQDGFSWRRLRRNLRHGVVRGRTKMYSEAEARDRFERHRPTQGTHRSVMVGWDNTPRRGTDGIVLLRSGTDAFREALDEAIRQTVQRHEEPERIVWLNAWNEWAEGNYIEPDTRFGRAYLEAVHEVNTLPPSDRGIAWRAGRR